MDKNLGVNKRMLKFFACEMCHKLLQMKNRGIYREKRRAIFVTGHLFTLTCGFILHLFGYYKLYAKISHCVHPSRLKIDQDEGTVLVSICILSDASGKKVKMVLCCHSLVSRIFNNYSMSPRWIRDGK